MKDNLKFIILFYIATFLFIACGDPTNVKHQYDYSGRCYEAPDCLRCAQSHSCFWCTASNSCTSIKGVFCEKETVWKPEGCSLDR
jgi:hypothetical protein